MQRNDLLASPTARLLGALGLALLFTGCDAPSAGPTAGSSPGSNDANDQPAAEQTAPEASDEPFRLGDLTEPFDPPPLAELDATADWQPRPVVDSLRRLIEFQASEPEPPTEAEALATPNDTPEANAKIRAGLGRVRVAASGDFYGDEPEIDWDAEIVRHAYVDINSTNPILTSSITETEVNGLTAFGLFSFDWQMQPFASADTVVSWQTSKDGLFDKVVLRDDLTWSDGKPITAHDLVFSYLAIMTGTVPVPAVRTGTNELRSVHAYDDHTLVFFHKRALVTNVWNVNYPVLPKHIYEKSIASDPTLTRSPQHVKLEDAPVVGGAYQIVRRDRGQEILLERREDYYMHGSKQVRDKPFFKTIRFKVIPDLSVALLAAKKGDLDELTLTPDQWTTQTSDGDFYKDNTKVQFTQWLTWSFTWNVKEPFFSDVRVRRAMGLAFDHQELLSKLRHGLDTPATGEFHPESPWAPENPPQPMTQDLRAARALLTEAGWTDTDGDGLLDKEINGESTPFEFTIICRNQQWRIDVCNLLAENLEQLGIGCNVRPLEATVLQNNLLEHRFQASFGGWSTGADPDTSQNIFGTGEGRNFGYYSSPEVDRLFQQAKTEFDLEARRKLYGQISLKLWEDQPFTWLFYETSYHAFNKRLRGYTFSPRGPYSFGPGFSSIYQPTLQ